MSVPRDDLMERVTRRMQAFGDPTRIRLIFALEEHDASVQQLADELELVHRNVSHGLNVLYREGLVSRRKVGTSVIYALADYSACQLIRHATEGVRAQIEELSELIARTG